MFALPGRQGGLLGQADRLGRGRWAAVLGLKRRGEFGAPGVDRGAAGGPGAHQVGVDAGDLAHAAFAGFAAVALGEPDPEPLA